MTTHNRHHAFRRIRSLGGRSVALVILGLILGVLPSLTATPAFGGTVVCFLDTDGNLKCPGDDQGGQQPAARFDPPPLLSPRVVADAAPAQAAALQRFETRAADQVLSRHDLPASDRDAVLTWARPETQGVLWELVVDAVHTDKFARTSDEQAVVDWIAGQADAQTASAAQQAGAEYAAWAGLDLSDYRSLAASGTESQLRDFLSQTPVPYGKVGSAECTKVVCTTRDQAGGYCNYRSPNPYGDEYTGYTNQTCYLPCMGLWCPPPAPSFDQLVKWGTAVATRDTASKEYEVAYGAIATGVVAATAILAAATAAVATYIATSVVAQITVQNLAMFTVFATTATAVGTTAGTVVAAASGIAVAVAAVLTLVLSSIQFADQEKLPGKLAALVVGARDPQLDPAVMMASDTGKQTLFSLFVSATMPNPRSDQTCDNSLIPVHLWGGQQDQVTISDPVTGKVRTISTWPCLNPTPVAQPADDAPHFYVRAGDSSDVLEKSSLTLPVPKLAGFTTQVRVAGNWFVQDVSDGSSTMRTQTLGLTYEDWDGHARYATVNRQADGSYVFTGLTEKGLTEGVDPASCADDDTCFTADHVRFVGADGQRYEASLEGDRAPVGEPTHSAARVFRPVMFEAGGFRMAHANGALDYQWEFQTPGCGGPCLVAHGDHAAYTWNKAGTYQVELTATDAAGQQVVKDLDVTVASTPPELTVFPDCASAGGGSCSDLSVSAGSPVVLWSKVSHDIASLAETETVRITWGDTTPDVATHVHDSSGDPDLAIRFGDTSATTFMVTATHTYRDPGVHHGLVTVHDNAENLDVKEPFTITVAP